jgi:RHS repeat-associated protein
MQYQDYYPYGMIMPGRNGTASGEKYRYGMNGMETNTEISGQFGNNYTTFFRQYDARLGRWFSTDPVIHTNASPYNGFDNNPILVADPRGDDGEPQNKGGDAPVEKGDTFIGDDGKTYSTSIGEAQVVETKGSSGSSAITLADNPVSSSSPSTSIGKEIPQHKSTSKSYLITNEQYEDKNWGQYPVEHNSRGSVTAQVIFISRITASINDNIVHINGMVDDVLNTFTENLKFAATAYLYDEQGDLVDSKKLSKDLDYSQGQTYFTPQGWVGSTTFELPDANSNEAQIYEVVVLTTGSYSTATGGGAITMPGTLFMKPNLGENSFSIEIINE